MKKTIYLVMISFTFLFSCSENDEPVELFQKSTKTEEVSAIVSTGSGGVSCQSIFGHCDLNPWVLAEPNDIQGIGTGIYLIRIKPSPKKGAVTKKIVKKGILVKVKTPVGTPFLDIPSKFHLNQNICDALNYDDIEIEAGNYPIDYSNPEYEYGFITVEGIFYDFDGVE